jgi:RNA-directed DNA polymerase
MYASHRDACILSKYAHDLTERLDAFYDVNNLSDHIIAYRKLGKANYSFSSEAYRFALKHSPCVVLCFDITGFFDNLDHSLLKTRLKLLLGVSKLSDDWFKVFRSVTKYRSIELSDLEAHPLFGARIRARSNRLIATISELKLAGIGIQKNANSYGIPQGTPISSVLSNLYMMDFDLVMAQACRARGALYQRYSDDILVICDPLDEVKLVASVLTLVQEQRLEIKSSKTERVAFGGAGNAAFQYLGFNVAPNGAAIRPSSLGRQWRRMKRAIRRAERIGKASILSGASSSIFTKRLRAQLSPVGCKNFSSYSRRAAKLFGSKKILSQALRLEQTADREIRRLKAIK